MSVNKLIRIQELKSLLESAKHNLDVSVAFTELEKLMSEDDYFYFLLGIKSDDEEFTMEDAEALAQGQFIFNESERDSLKRMFDPFHSILD